MNKYLIFLPVLICLGACSTGDVQNIVNIARNPDPLSAAKSVATNKAAYYAANPKKIETDYKAVKNNFDRIFKQFAKAVAGKWGDFEKPTTRKYVKYTQNYTSRAVVDFDKGIVTVTTVDDKAPYTSLKNAIVTTILTPEDPRSVELYSDKDVKLEGQPFLGGMVRDHQNKVVLYEWRANQYARYLIKNKIQTKMTSRQDESLKTWYVTFPLVNEHENIRAQKYRQIVEKYARKYNLETSLVYAIIKTESNFNPYAVSRIPAYGLMQIVPATAGQDSHQHIYGKKGIPGRNTLFDPEQNIHYGTAYLDILFTRYLKNIQNPISREYAVISAYNTGSGNVLRTFSKNRTEAFRQINQLKPASLYWKLKTQLPYDETRRYLVKVTDAKKEFVRF